MDYGGSGSTWRRARGIALAAGIVLSGGSCVVADLFEPGPLSIVGRVVEAYDGTTWPPSVPIAGVVVRLRGDTDRFATTDAFGRYEFRDVGNGYFQVSLVLPSGGSRPGSHVTQGVHRERWTVDFQVEPGVGHVIAGTVDGLDATKRIVWAYACCTNVTYGLVIDGAFVLEPLRLNYHEVGIHDLGGRAFTPAMVELVPTIEFAHPMAGSGALGAVTVASVLEGATDVAGCFEVLLGPESGRGTIRPRHRRELGGGTCPPFNTIWGDGRDVTVTFDSGLGALTIALDLVWWYEFSATSADFAVTERLVPSTGLHFTMNPP